MRSTGHRETANEGHDHRVGERRQGARVIWRESGPHDHAHLDGFVAGDDQAAKDKVLEFVESIDFRPIDAGPLAMARTLEGMAFLNIMLHPQHKWPWQNGWKLVGPPAD